MADSQFDDAEQQRIRLRRETHDLNDLIDALAERLNSFNPDAHRAVSRAHSALFEAWTYLCVPPEDEDDHEGH